MLGGLLLTPGEVVRDDLLAEFAWGLDGATASALHTAVSRLRAWLKERLELDAALKRSGGGYRIVLADQQVDAARFRALVAAASEQRDSRARMDGLSEALDLWRGPVLDGLDRWLSDQPVVVGLQRLRVEAAGRLCEAAIASGAPDRALPELERLAAVLPFEESVQAGVVTLLDACGRRADAVRHYQAVRGRLAEELEVEPSEVLHRAYLNARKQQTPGPEPAIPGDEPSPDTRPVVPGAVRQLPRDVAEFTGRAADLRYLRKLVDAMGDDGPQVTVVAIQGMAGVGKTRLAVRAAHHLVAQGRFDEIQLWAELRGCEPDRSAADPGAVLDDFLRALGVPAGQVPASVPDRAALYRSRLAGRRALVVLDDAATEAQVRPLLPGGPGSLVLITSRRALSGLDGVEPMTLEPLPTGEAVELLARISGRDRVAADPGAAARIVEVCGGLPSALAAVARQLQARPAWTPRYVLGRLIAEGGLLGRLSVRERSVPDSFDASYYQLPAQQRRIFRMISLHPGEDVTAVSAAALADVSPPQAEAVLESLLDEHLVQQAVAGRYRLHPLVGRYARRLADRDESEQGRYVALGRLVDCYLSAAQHATRLRNPSDWRHLTGARAHPGPIVEGLSTAAQAIGWAEQERANLIATVGAAADLSGALPVQAVRLAAALFRPLANRGHIPDRLALAHLAMRAADRIGDDRRRALALEDTANINLYDGVLPDAIVYTKRALDLWRAVGDRIGEAKCVTIFGIIHRQQGHFDQAVADLEMGLALSRAIGDRVNEAVALNYLGLTHQGLRNFHRAIDYHRRSMLINEEFGDHFGEAVAVSNLAWAHQRSHEPDLAIAHHQRGLDLFRGIADLYNEAEQLWGLGQAHNTLGHTQRARDYWNRSIAILADTRLLAPAQADTLLSQPIPDTPAIIRLNT
ncbi:AfsR/SARP family transcriptional regulator [Actinomadura rubrisoli]|uniref:AfsR/SARP family transcriptional regulator n=1 Tax=Actinomadura rubrisoli TaxID=2530368 RepID=UPI0014053775|nr:BTAD domain-containing putative transcriptional regulator [Actinomadura rubrisoli]